MPSDKRNRGSQGKSTAEELAAAPESRSGFQLPWGLVLMFVTAVLAYLPAMSGGLLCDDDAHTRRPELVAQI